MIDTFAMDWNLKQQRVEVICFDNHKVVGRAANPKRLAALMVKHGTAEDIADIRPIWRDLYKNEHALTFDAILAEAIQRVQKLAICEAQLFPGETVAVY